MKVRDHEIMTTHLRKKDFPPMATKIALTNREISEIFFRR